MAHLRVPFVIWLLGVFPAMAPPRAAAQETCTRATADRVTTPTTECTDCHDSEGTASSAAAGARGHGHAVDVDYQAVRASRPNAFVPREQLPPIVTLADGRITCLTCHGRTERGGEVHKLGRELCLGCHTLR